MYIEREEHEGEGSGGDEDTDVGQQVRNGGREEVLHLEGEAIGDASITRP